MSAQNVIWLNEAKASKLMEQGKYGKAEKILLQNTKSGCASFRTYQLLFRIYSQDNDYGKIIRILDQAIKCSKEKEKFFRELKRVTILNRLLEDIMAD
ncbi:MAG: hypothetical protein PHN32_07885 [Actinomycetota bacterium]|jgi:predicted Zn-dependent protease|nr:hypothetical protein [Actinomycetota bacterium]